MKKNIAFIIPSLRNGGAERVLSTLSTSLDDKFKQYILAWDTSEPDYDFNAELININIHNSNNIFKNIYVLLKRVVEVKKYKKKYKIETSISHLEGPNIVNLLSKGKDKVIITVHSFDSTDREGIYKYIFKLLIRFLYNKADKIVVVSKVIKESLISEFKLNESKIIVIYNMFDTNKIENKGKELIEKENREIFEKNDVLITTGRLIELKGQRYIIEAFKKVNEAMEKTHLVILGAGPLEGELKSLVRKLNLEKKVTFLGFQKNPFKYIRSSKVFILSSFYEGFPMCIPEAMACEIPVISVDCKSGPREILDPNSNLLEKTEKIKYCEYGVLIQPFKKNKSNHEEIEFLKNAIIKVLQDKTISDTYIKNAKKRVKEFDIRKIKSEWEKII